jgi:dTDP-4-amino-4,6-dideoxygalactose transaminase
MIPFNIPPFCPGSETCVHEAIASHKISGDGDFTKKCHAWIQEHTGTSKALLTTSGTHALEMAALLCDLQPGDEVILPSYTFSSTANAFVLAGAKLVFVDIRPDTMNLDERLIEAAITPKTRVICAVHYAGVSCAMDEIMAIARRHNLLVVEDAAQGVMSFYKGRALGAIGDFGCYSYHETKNYSMGEGGALLIQNDDGRAEILREKGTNRSQFFRGMVDKYTWVDYGSSYLPSELNAAYLYGQLEVADEINAARLHAWDRYHEQLSPLEAEGCIALPHIPAECIHNAHMFWIKAKDLSERTALIDHLKQRGIGAAFHYVPLHSAPAGQRFGRFHGEDVYTTAESDRLLRLPMYYGLTDQEVDTVVQAVTDFYHGSRTRP